MCDFLYRSWAAAATRAAWLVVLLAAAALQREDRRRVADWAGRVVGLVSGAASVALVHAYGGAGTPLVSFLYVVPIVHAVLAPDLPSAAVLAGAGSTVGGVILLAAAQQPPVITVQWAVLTFSRGGEPVKKSVQLGAALRASASFAVRGSRARCECEVPDDLWPVLADEGQIGQVIQNLVLNAVQAMPDGGVVRVRAENVSGERAAAAGLLHVGRSVRVAVSDGGRGVPPDIRHRIFDPYFTTKATGTGLGLATAHSIVTRHGGEIGLEPAPGDGTTFYFALPAAAAEPAPAAPRAGASPSARGRVVVLDDKEFVLRAAERMLRRIGYEVFAVRDGAEVLGVCDRQRQLGAPVDAALMDLTIPDGMGGAEAAELLRTFHPDVKAVVSSGYSSDPIMADHARYGFCGVVAKPYRLEDLSAVLHEVLRGRKVA